MQVYSLCRLTPVLNNKNTQKVDENNLLPRQCNSIPLFAFKGQVKLDNDYDKWFKSYLKFVDEKFSIANEIIDVVSEPQFYNSLNEKDTIKVLDIGCGNGVLTQNYLNGISKIFPSKNIEVDALDVNKNLIKDFRENNYNLSSNIQIDLQKKDFFKSSNNNKYDLIIASHVMYYTDDLSDSLNKIESSLSDDGKAIIFHHSGEDCILSELRAKYNSESMANLKQSKDDISTNDIIKSTLEKENINHKSKKQFFNLYFPQNDKTQDFRNLISFLADKPFMELVKENKIAPFINEIKEKVDDDNALKLNNNMYILESSKTKNIDYVGPQYNKKIDIIFSDIDGTLSVSDDYISPTTIKAVDDLNKVNIPLVLTTARCYKDTLPIINSFNQKPEYTIVLQGGSIIDKNGNAVVENIIPELVGKELINWVGNNLSEDKNSHLIMYFDEQPYSTTNIQFPWKAVTKIEQVNSFDDLFKKNMKLQKAILYKINAKPSDVVNIESSFNKANITQLQLKESGTGFYEFQNADVSKDKAIKYILKNLSINPKNVMSIGDSSNDIEMLDYIKDNKGLAVAMGNANNKVKEHANAVTSDVNSDGFAYVINKII